MGLAAVPARATTERHPDVLIEQGLARRVEAEGIRHYVLDHEGLFVAVDHVRRLAPAPAPEGGETRSWIRTRKGRGQRLHRPMLRDRSPDEFRPGK